MAANNIFGNYDYGLSNEVPGLFAANNYWGAASGPGANPADEVSNVGGGTAIVTPFATKPFKVQVSIKP